MSKAAPSPIRVLIADDHPVVRQGLRSMLSGDDIEVVGEAGSGSEVVALAQQLQPDVVLMDIRMPDMDGISAMAAMKRGCAACSVIVLTTYNNVQYLIRSVVHGAAGYFLKGISRDDLLTAVRKVATGETLLKPHHLRAVMEAVVREDAKSAPFALTQMDVLTAREQEVLGLIVQGLTNRQIGQVLSVSPATVRTHVGHIIAKLGVSDRTQAAVWAVRAGLAGM
jgi:DNA-binding NarL/FixJ family response regulator